jgi:putative phage-type endonuclease
MSIWEQLDDDKRPTFGWATKMPVTKQRSQARGSTQIKRRFDAPEGPGLLQRSFEAPGLNLGAVPIPKKRSVEAPGINFGASPVPPTSTTTDGGGGGNFSEKRNFEAPGINFGASPTPSSGRNSSELEAGTLERNFEAPGINFGASSTPSSGRNSSELEAGTPERNFEAPGINFGASAAPSAAGSSSQLVQNGTAPKRKESAVLTQMREEEERQDALILREMPSIMTRDMQMQIIMKVFVKTAGDIRRISQAAQRSEEWHVARLYRLTGSRIGAAVGQSPYTTPDQLLREMLWPAFKGNASTRRGTLFEPYAGRSYLRFERQKSGQSTELAIPGAVVSKLRPYFAYSPDGIVMCDNGSQKLIEIKCPVKSKPYPRIPSMYMAQMQMGMWLLGLQSCDFVVYCGEGPYARVEVIDDKKMFVTAVPRDDIYLERMLLPKATEFWFKRFLPLRIALECGWLKRGQVHLPAGIRLELLDQSVFDELRTKHPF